MLQTAKKGKVELPPSPRGKPQRIPIKADELCEVCLQLKGRNGCKNGLCGRFGK